MNPFHIKHTHDVNPENVPYIEKEIRKQLIPHIDGTGEVRRIGLIAKERNRSIRKRFKPMITTMQIHKKNKGFLERYMEDKEFLKRYKENKDFLEKYNITSMTWDLFIVRVVFFFKEKKLYWMKPFYSDFVTPIIEEESLMKDLTTIEIHVGTRRLLESLSHPDESLENTLVRAVKCLKGFELLKESEG